MEYANVEHEPTAIDGRAVKSENVTFESDPEQLIAHQHTTALPSESVDRGFPHSGHLHLELDEETLRSLQQFMEAQNLQQAAGISSTQTRSASDNEIKTKQEPTLAQEIAQHYLPNRTEIKSETEEERKARSERVRQENRERKKRWREQNADRNKDNDLRCRVNKRATLIYGADQSPQKQLYIENEFRKRQRKRLGRDPSPIAESADATDVYSTILNSPEFANILMSLLAQKGLDAGDTETSTQLVELLKTNPDFLKGLLPTLSEPEDVKQVEAIDSSVALENYGQQAALETFDSSYIEPVSQPLQHESDSIDPSDPISEPIGTTAYSAPLPAPIPHLGIKRKHEEEPKKFTPIPMPGYKPQLLPSRVQPRPSQERVQALGFPPMPSTN